MKKRMLIVGIICFIVVLPLQGCGNSSEEVSSIIEETSEETTELTSESTSELIDKTTIETTTELITEAITEELTESTTQASIVQSNGSDVIYVTKTGKKYHYNNNCNGATYIEITPEQLNAEYSTLEPCSKCAM